MADGKSVKLVKEQLYNEIWEISVSGVAKKYDVHYATLLKLCKAAEIPVPPSGYWMKLAFGKPTEKPHLSLSETTEIVLPCGPPVKNVRPKPDAEIKDNVDDKVTKTVEPNKKVLKEEELPASEQPAAETVGQDLDALMPWERDGRHNVYKRTKLYDEVWSKPVQQVAVQYGVSNTTIKKICRKLNVPVPPRGYWAKLKAGIKTKRILLPDTKGQTQFIGARTHRGVTPTVQDTQPLSFLPDLERAEVLTAARQIELPSENTRL